MENNNFVPVNETPVNETPVVETPIIQVPGAAPATPVAEAPASNDKPGLGNIAEKFGGAKKPIIAIVAVLLAVLIVVGGIFAVVGLVGNNYKRPLKIMEKYENKKSYYDPYERIIDLSNGFCKSELKAIYKLYKSTEDYEDEIDDMKDAFEDIIDDYKDKYGKNYKFNYEFDDEDELDNDEIDEIEDLMKETADDIEDLVEETEDWDSDDWEDFADELGFDDDKGKAKKLIKNIKSIGKKLDKAKIKEGYKVEYTRTITGKEIDDPDDYEYEGSYNVYKINGKWVPETVIYSLSSYADIAELY